MYMTVPSESEQFPTVAPATTAVAALALVAAGIFYLGILPSTLIQIATASVATVF
jgi:hypothetical protein